LQIFAKIFRIILYMFSHINNALLQIFLACFANFYFSLLISHTNMKTIVFLLGLASILITVQGGVINHPKDANCDVAKFKLCSAYFAAELGIQNLNKNSTLLAFTMSQLLKTRGLDGQKQICKAGKDLRKCAGDQYAACMDLDFLKSQGVSPEDATVFDVLSKQELYICTTGWDVVTKNWDCIQKVSEASEKYLQQCVIDMTKHIQDDPKNLCKYLQQMTDCYDAPYKKSCAPTVPDTLCESIKFSLEPVIPQCTITCPKA